VKQKLKPEEFVVEEEGAYKMFEQNCLPSVHTTYSPTDLKNLGFTRDEMRSTLGPGNMVYSRGKTIVFTRHLPGQPLTQESISKVITGIFDVGSLSGREEYDIHRADLKKSLGRSDPNVKRVSA